VRFIQKTLNVIYINSLYVCVHTHCLYYPVSRITTLLARKKSFPWCSIKRRLIGFVWLIMFWFTSLSRIFHLYGDVTIVGEGLQNLGLCSAVRAFEPEGPLGAVRETQTFKTKHYFLLFRRNIAEILLKRRKTENQSLVTWFNVKLRC
jgi:hypothetical protein